MKRLTPVVAGLLQMGMLAAWWAAPANAESETTAAPRRVDFASDVAPIFRQRCLSCHGPDEQQSGLRLDDRARLMLGGDFGGPAVVPSEPSRSFLLNVISGDGDLVMPPEGEPLTEVQVATIRTWIEQGVRMPAPADTRQGPGHWSFQPPSAVSPPSSDRDWIRTPIDGFVLARLREAGLEPSADADHVALVRRIYLVMLGIPPSPEEVAAFVADTRPLAYERLVDRVLSSPRYGERWGRHWLDVVRFGETHGFETNRERPNAWRYRDYVIDALNSDKPFDVFVREQLAGDALGAPVGTGFLVAGPYDLVKSPDINLTLMQRQDELADMINTTGTAFLGLTLGCARCHNHKFDPVSQVDYYAMQAVFAGVEHGERPLPKPAGVQRKLAEIDRRIGELLERLAQYRPAGAREPVNARRNVEPVEAREVRYVRFTVEATSNGAEPCLDELEIWSEGENVALASAGAQATCSSLLPGYEIHQLEHINDGRYGNARSWISNEPAGGWIQIELARPRTIDRIEWGRDREGRYADRLPTQYRIEGALEPGRWTLLASSDDRRPPNPDGTDEPVFRFDNLPPEEASRGRRLHEEWRRLKRRREELGEPAMAYAGNFRKPPPTHRLYRGDPMAKREVVAPDAPRQFGQLSLAADASEQERRIQLAEWIADSGNPLTARVIVNRLWQYHFGTGFVSTPNDFGGNGSTPSHPELLDWLARELTASNWSLKHIHRLILTSSTFRQSALPNEKGMAIDAGSRLLWRFPPRRLEAEPIRDSILAASGVLDLRMGGPGFSGFKVEKENVRHYFPKEKYGPVDWRRMVYMTKVRQEQDSVFGTFDCPDASQVVPRRSRSTTPLQALNLFNSSFVLQQAGLLARRLQSDVPNDPHGQVERAFQICFGRNPQSAETREAVSLVEEVGLPALCRALLNSNEFLFIP